MRPVTWRDLWFWLYAKSRTTGRSPSGGDRVGAGHDTRGGGGGASGGGRRLAESGRAERPSTSSLSVNTLVSFIRLKQWMVLVSAHPVSPFGLDERDQIDEYRIPLVFRKEYIA